MERVGGVGLDDPRYAVLVEHAKHVALIGYRAAGKSTVGPAVATQIALPFVDLDDAVLAELGHASVIEAWETESEAIWRAAEGRCLARCLQGPPCVLALGGGVPTTPEASSLLEAWKCQGKIFVVYLACSPERLTRRLGQEAGDRPPLHGHSVEGEVKAVLKRRHPIYQSMADVEIDADTDGVDEVIARVVEELVSVSSWESGGDQGDASG